MEIQESQSEGENGFKGGPSPRKFLPYDLPKSLDDRQPVRDLGTETEIYDAWQGTV